MRKKPPFHVWVVIGPDGDVIEAYATKKPALELAAMMRDEYLPGHDPLVYKAYVSAEPVKR